MNYFDRVQKTIDYIEDNLKESLTLEELARISCFSKFHFHRVFQAVAGEALMDYIRKRRLSEAVLELQNPDKRITDIAFDYLFNSPETFSRAFKRQYGINPYEYRRSRPQVTLFEKKHVTEQRDIDSSQNEFFVKPDIVLCDNLKVIGLETFVSKNEFFYRMDDNNYESQADRAAEMFFFDLKRKVHNRINPNLEICYNYECEEGYMDMVCVFADSLKHIPEGMTGRVIPRNRYAVFIHEFKRQPEQITVKELEDNICKYAFGIWFPASVYEPAGSYSIELYDVSRRSEGITRVSFYIPVIVK